MFDFFPELFAIFRKSEFDARQLVGVWRLKSIAGKHPSAFSIRSHQIEFAPEGSWSFIAVMEGRLEGVTIKGSGEWRINADALEYTVLNQTRRSSVQIQDGVLTLTPDIAIAPDGDLSVAAAYVLD